MKLYRFLLPALLVVSCGGGNKAAQEDGQRLFVGDDYAVTQTQYGKVQGYILDGVYTYLGIPYGAPTGGENRFMPPQKPESWEGIRPAMFYGNDAPQNMADKWKNNSSTFTDHWNYYDVSEDCLNLNVWTPAPDGKKRPVLVWMHGGGFSAGFLRRQQHRTGRLPRCEPRPCGRHRVREREPSAQCLRLFRSLCRRSRFQKFRQCGCDGPRRLPAVGP